LTLAEKILAAKAVPYADFIRKLVAVGGLVEHARGFLRPAGGPSGGQGK
jgi:hypothetical protein